jgi:WhiB family redox-sensing transcriptional regulator
MHTKTTSSSSVHDQETDREAPPQQFGAARGRQPERHRRSEQATPAGGPGAVSATRVAVARRVAAAAVARGRMPVLGSVRHATTGSALGGCPCSRCEQVREQLLTPLPVPAVRPVPRRAPLPAPVPAGAGTPAVDRERAPLAVPAPAGRAAGVAAGEEWRLAAVCAQTDPEAFFPEKGGSPAAAKAVCARCPVTAECLDWALANDVRYGVWGGLSAQQRAGIRRRRGSASTVGGVR